MVPTKQLSLILGETQPIEILLDPTQAAGILMVAVPTLADWRTKQVGPDYVKVGRCVRYRRSDLEAWLTSRTRKGA
jgi:predicted DNA-binding transcriptional regulator AlpA